MPKKLSHDAAFYTKKSENIDGKKLGFVKIPAFFGDAGFFSEEFSAGNHFPNLLQLDYRKLEEKQICERKQNMAGFLTFTKEKPINRIVEVEVGDIVPNPHQPRTEFDIADIQSLAESISQNGILQPLTVRRGNGCYELIAGERRLRAAKMTGMQAVPCIILDISSRNSAIMALVENIQRQDLSFFDEASAIERLITYYGMTQEDAAAKLGKAQSTIANKLRLLRLTLDEREVIMKYNLTERHARALLRLASPSERLTVLEKVVKHNLNVERTEAAVEEMIGKSRTRESYKKRSKVFQNVRIFVNTINKAVETMQAAGIQADSQKIQRENYIEYRVRIPIGEK